MPRKKGRTVKGFNAWINGKTFSQLLSEHYGITDKEVLIQRSQEFSSEEMNDLIDKAITQYCSFLRLGAATSVIESLPVRMLKPDEGREPEVVFEPDYDENELD